MTGCHEGLHLKSMIYEWHLTKKNNKLLKQMHRFECQFEYDKRNYFSNNCKIQFIIKSMYSVKKSIKN